MIVSTCVSVYKAKTGRYFCMPSIVPQLSVYLPRAETPTPCPLIYFCPLSLVCHSPALAGITWCLSSHTPFLLSFSVAKGPPLYPSLLPAFRLHWILPEPLPWLLMASGPLPSRSHSFLQNCQVNFKKSNPFLYLRVSPYCSLWSVLTWASSSSAPYPRGLLLHQSGPWRYHQHTQ